VDIDLQKIPVEEKSVLRSLMQLCLHDYSEFNGEDVNEHGLFEYKYVDHYWTEPGRYPFFVKVSGKLAGFALARTLDAEGDETMYSLAEFFIMRKYRRQGIGTEVAVRLFDMFPGEWHVGQELGNIPAQTFWKKVVSRYTDGDYEETQDPEDEDPLQIFRSRCLERRRR